MAERPKVLKITRQPSGSKPTKAAFKTSVRKDGRKVHTYKSGRKVVLPKGKSGKAPAAVAPVDPYAAAVDAAARTKYEPVQQALTAQQGAQENRGGDLNAWYDRYKQAVAQATSANQQATQQAVGGLGALGNAAAANDLAGQAQVTQQMQADAASRGATVDPQVAVQMQQGSAVRGQNLAGSQAVQIGQGVQQTALDQQKNVAGEGTRVASLMENAARMRELQGKGTDLSREIGDFKTTYKDKLKQDEQQARLEQYLATGKLENDTAEVKIKAAAVQTAAQKAAADRRDKAQKRIIARRGQRTQAKGAAAQRRIQQQNADANTTRANKPSGGSGGSRNGSSKSAYRTPAQQATATKDLGLAKSVASELRRKGGSRARARQALLNGINKPGSTVSTIAVPDNPSTPQNEEQRVSTSVPGKKRDPINELTARIALDQVFNPGGLLSPETVKLMRAAGISVASTGARTRSGSGRKRKVRIANGNPGR